MHRGKALGLLSVVREKAFCCRILPVSTSPPLSYVAKVVWLIPTLSILSDFPRCDIAVLEQSANSIPTVRAGSQVP